MASFRLSGKYINRLNTRFQRYRRIRELIRENVECYISDYLNFKGTSQDRDEYLEQKYRAREPKENYIVADTCGNVMFHVREIALLTGRDSSSISRTLSQMEHSEGWYSKIVPLRHEAKSANNNTIYVYDKKIFDLIVDYREYKYLERIKRAGIADFGEVMRYWEYLKNVARYENHSASDSGVAVVHDGDSDITELPEIPPVSWQDIMRLIGGKLFSVRADMIFAIAFAVTFGLARRLQVLIPVFAGMSAVLLLVCVLMLRYRASRANMIAEAGAIFTLLTIFWGINLTMENGIYTPGGTVMNLSAPEPSLKLDAIRGEYLGESGYPVIFFVNADNEADIKEIYYRTDSKSEYKSSGRNELGGVQLRLRPKFSGNIITIDLKYIDTEDKEHGPYTFMFDVEKARFNSGKNAVINHPDILYVIERIDRIIINSFMNDTVKAVHYGINTEIPDMVYVPDFDEGYHGDGDYVVDEIYEDVDFVSLYTEFTDETSSDIHIKYIEGGKRKTPSHELISV